MTYDELLAQYGEGIRKDGDAIAMAVKNVYETVQGPGGVTTKITMVFGALIPLFSTLTTFLTLSAEGRALVFAESFDAAVGNEPTALVKEFLIFGTEETEELGDSLKKIAFKVFHKQFLAAEAAVAGTA